MHGHVMQFWTMGGKGKFAKGFLGERFSLSDMQKEKGLTLPCLLPLSVGTTTL